jgi:hypothetical protein
MDGKEKELKQSKKMNKTRMGVENARMTKDC